MHVMHVAMDINYHLRHKCTKRHISSYWNKRDFNRLLPQNNKGLKGHLERFQFVSY